jgi:hypothetical protein
MSIWISALAPFIRGWLLVIGILIFPPGMLMLMLGATQMSIVTLALSLLYVAVWFWMCKSSDSVLSTISGLSMFFAAFGVIVYIFAL